MKKITRSRKNLPWSARERSIALRTNRAHGLMIHRACAGNSFWRELRAILRMQRKPRKKSPAR